MSEDDKPSAVGSPLTDSHNLRSAFEKSALVVFLAIVVLFATAALAGVLMPPAPPKHPDWGATIVARAAQLNDTLWVLLVALIGGTGGSMIRGHMDLRSFFGKRDDA